MDGELMHDDTYAAKPEEAKLIDRVNGYLKRAKKADTRWRPRALEGVKFYFDEQWEEKDKLAVEARGQHPVTNNRIKNAVNVVLGLMLGRPMDWLAKPQGKNDDELSEAATAALKYVANRSRFGHVRKQVYFDGLTYGLGVCHIGPHVRHKDPRREVVQHRRIDPREFRWDPQAQEPDLADARWVIWSRKVDLADAKRAYPKHRDYLADKAGEKQEEGTAGGVTVNEGLVGVTPPPSMWDSFDDWNMLDKGEGGDDPGVKQVLLHECWEVQQEKAWLIEFADGQPVEFDPTTPEGAQMLNDPGLKAWYQDDVPRVYKHVFCGKLLLESVKSPHKHDRIPFVTFFFSRDHNGDPVSFVETLKEQQREVNYRRAKMLHELGGEAIVVDPEVLSLNGMTAQQFAAHYKKPGAIIQARPGQVSPIPRSSASGQGQFELMRHSEESIQKNGGTNDHLMGYDGPAESGKSKEISMMQGATSLRDAEENLGTFSQAVGELTLADIQAFHTGQWVVRITDEVGKDKLITINEQRVDPETGQVRVLNHISQVPFELEIDTTPWTPTLRTRTFEAFSEMANNEPDPILKMAYRRIAITASDMPGRAQALELLSQAEQASMQAQQAAAMPPPPPMGPPGGMPMMPPEMPPPPGPEMAPGLLLPPAG